MRWLATSVIPDAYEKLSSDEKQNLADASAMSHFLAGIEARAIDSMASHCYSICERSARAELLHVSLQFGGAEIPMRPFPVDFKATAERAIKEKSGFDVTLVQKTHSFLSKKWKPTPFLQNLIFHLREDRYYTKLGTVSYLVSTESPTTSTYTKPSLKSHVQTL